MTGEIRIEGRGRFTWLSEWLPEIVFVLLTTVAGLIAGGRWVDPYGDPGFSWSLAHRIAGGEALYRDVYLNYGPLSPYLLGGLAKLVGSSTWSVMLWNWIPAIVAGILLLRCGRPYLSGLERIACAVLIVGFSVLAPGPGRVVFPYYAGVAHALALSLGAILLVREGRTGELTRSLFGGFLAGLAFCAKQEIGVAALIALIAARFPRPKEVLSHTGRAVGGFLIAVLPGALLAASNASLRSLRDDNHLWPADVIPPLELARLYRLVMGMSPVDWSASVREVAWGLLLTLLFLAVAAMLFVREFRVSQWRQALILAGALLVWWLIEGFSEPFRMPVALSATIAFAAALFAIWRRDLPNHSQLIAIGVFAGLVGARTIFSPRISGPYDGPAHLASSLTWVVFLCVVAPRLLVPAEKAALVMRRMAAVFLLVVAGFGAFTGADSLRYPWKRRVATRMGDVFLSPNEASFFEKLRGELRLGETALVVPEINAVDVLFGVRSVSPLPHLLPGLFDARIERELMPRLAQSPPDVVVIFNRPMLEFGFPRFGSGYGTVLEKWILRNYQLVLSDRVGSVLRRSRSAIGPIHALDRRDQQKSAGSPWRQLFDPSVRRGGPHLSPLEQCVRPPAPLSRPPVRESPRG